MLWFNADEPATVALPENDWVHTGEVVLITDAELPAGTNVKAGDELAVGPRTVVVMRED